MIRAVTFALLLAISFIIYKQSSNQYDSLRCQADVTDNEMLNETDTLSSNIRLNYIFNSKKESLVNITGFITLNNKKYRILRTIYFTLDISDNKDLYDMSYTHEKIHSEDNVPKEAIQKLMAPQFNGGSNNIRISKIKDNTYLIHGISQPVALCYRY